MATQVIMPQLGESVVEGTVGRWLVSEGQPVKQYDPLVQITTDKVDTEVTATSSGVLLRILVPEGQTVERGTVLALIGEPGETAGDEPGVPEGAGQQPGQVADPAGSPSGPTAVPMVTPVAQRMAQEHGVDLAGVRGSGPGGRITSEDVAAHLAAQPPEAEQVTGPAAAPAAEPPAAAPAGQRNLGFISPVVARLAAEYQVDLTRVTGTGEGGRITRKDVQAYLAARKGGAAAPAPGAPPASAVAPAAEPPPWEQPGTGTLFKPTEQSEEGTPVEAPVQAQAQPPQPVTPHVPAAVHAPDGAEVRPLSNIRRSIAKHMVLSKQTSAHVTTVMEADMTRVVQARDRLRDEYARQGVKLTYTPFLVQAAVAGLRAVPEANSSFNEESLLVHRHIHIGMAVAIPDGLLVPVIRDADEKSLLGLARSINDLAERARAKRLSPDEVQGGTFTLTNHGTAGSLLATPIINQPQAGILGVGAIQKRPVVISRGSSLLPGPDDYLAIRPMAYLSFTFDHRILDGAGADDFLAAVKAYLEQYQA